MLEVHLIIQAALQDAVPKGIINRNVALIAHAPRLRSIPKDEQQAWTSEQLREFLREAVGHRLFPASWLISTTGLRRSELLGLRWEDIDFARATVSVNRALVAVAYELHETRGKTQNSRRAIDLDPTTVDVLKAWSAWQRVEQRAVGIEPSGWVFTDTDGNPVHPHFVSQAFERIAARAGGPKIRLHDLRHTHGTLLIKAGVPVKVVSERLGSRQSGLHHRHLPARPPRDAGRRCPGLREPDQTRGGRR